MSTDYLESLFTGMSIIIDKKISEVSFDKTIVCTIVGNENKKNGEYRVFDGSIEFTAYCDNDKYQIDDQVLVKILQGDFTKNKIIEGRYIADNNIAPITYTSPLDKVVNISGNLIDTTYNTQYGIKANDDKEQEKIIWAVGYEDLTKINNSGIYDTITLKANFKTLFSNSDLKDGNYGLKLQIYIAESVDSTTLLLNTVKLDSSEMFGNPYAFSVYSKQEKSFAIKTEGFLYALKLILYQDKNFKDIEGKILPVNEYINDILVKDIELGIGNDLTKVADNTLQLYTIDSLE